jgi:methylenetetrahydrofolate dehydrogenase (NADP+)/methenyltetrahydrofolate cyclohydrolase
MLVLDGLQVSKARRQRLQQQIQEWPQEAPGLAVILVGEDPASHVYVRNKVKACAEVGIHSFHHQLPKDATQGQLSALLAQLRADARVDGILVQLPLPAGLSSEKVLRELDPLKDADGLTTENIGLFFAGQPRVLPCTPKGVMSILEHYQIKVARKHAVVIGRSQIVGKPMAQLLLNADATVTICHSRTENIEEHSRRADLVVVAAGQPRRWGREAFRRGAVVIDVGIHRQVVTPGGPEQLCGDVRFEELEGWAEAATPVPRGVGPMTITSLLENTFHLAQLRRG